MTFAIPGLGAIPAVSAPASGAAGSATSAAQGAGGGSSGGGFMSSLAHAIDGLQSTQTAANEQAVSVAAGTGNIADYMITAAQATLATQLTVTLTNQATSAFNMIMNMNL